MPTTRKKIIKTVYKDEDSEGETGDFSDSGSEAKISEASSSEDEVIDDKSSGDDFSASKKATKNKQPIRRRKARFAKDLINKINKQMPVDEVDATPGPISVNDLTDADKLLPSILNLSESDSSDDETQTQNKRKLTPASSVGLTSVCEHNSDGDNETHIEYRDVWSNNKPDNSDEIAKKTFLDLEKHTKEFEQTKAAVQSYISKNKSGSEANVKDLLAAGEQDEEHKSPITPKKKTKKRKDDSDSEIEDWEEVKESKSIPQQGLQLFVELPDSVCRKSKKIDVEMMMKRKINRVKKEYQMYMHKVHVLCWLGHGNYVNRVLNDEEVMAAALAMVPKGCYPEERVTVKYVEQITIWFKDKLTLKQDKNEHKFKPRAPPLKNILLNQINTRVTTAKKYNVFIFVSMLRALGLQCRIMFNFVALPIRPPSSELCSLSTKSKDITKTGDKSSDNKAGASSKNDKEQNKLKTAAKSKPKCKSSIAQVDGINDTFSENDTDDENIMQLDGNSDMQTKTRSKRSTRAKKVEEDKIEDESVSPPKRSKMIDTAENDIKDKLSKSPARKIAKNIIDNKIESGTNTRKSPKRGNEKKNEARKPPAIKRAVKKKDGKNETKMECDTSKSLESKSHELLSNLEDQMLNSQSSLSISNKAISIDTTTLKVTKCKGSKNATSARKTRSTRNNSAQTDKCQVQNNSVNVEPPAILVTDENHKKAESKFFSEPSKERNPNPRKRSRSNVIDADITEGKSTQRRTKSATGTAVEKSKYFGSDEGCTKKAKVTTKKIKTLDSSEDKLRVSHKELVKPKGNSKGDVTRDLVNIIKSRIKVEKAEGNKRVIKGKVKEDSDDDSDFLPVEESKNHDSDDDFKPTKISPQPMKVSAKASTSKKIDRRVLSSDDDPTKTNKVDVWCEVFVEELEQWIAVDVIKGKVHCANDLYKNATHPVCYVVGWDNNNYLKDVTRRYVPHWNTVTRRQRAEPQWWRAATHAWLAPECARDTEEDQQLHRMQLEAPLPKSIAEYKNHPLYALKRHLLKFEALYPAECATLGFVRGEAVYARGCVHTCRSRDTWLKEAKVVKLGEQPYKVVKARPKWDKLSNKMITDKPLEVFGPWQVQEYEPPTAENGKVPRNPYGNVELFKECMLPKGTVHIKLPGLNKVARKLNIDCAPAMTGFDFNGGWSHPVYDGFVVCSEFQELITDAWVKEQEEQERRELEKIELRVYGNWKRLIRGLMIRERLKLKYGFEEPATTQTKTKSKGPRFVAKKK